jgi:predicted DNA binding protein
MRSLSLRLSFDDDGIHPMHAFISDDDRYGPTRLLQWNPTAHGTNLMVFRVAGPKNPYTDALENSSSIRYYETTAVSSAGSGFSVLVEDEITDIARQIVETYADERVIVIPPVVFHPNRSADLQFVGENPSLQRLLDRLPDTIDAEVRRLTTAGPSMVPFVDRLTDRQRRVMTVALERGYYDEPRTATLEDVAAELGLAAGTVAEHVRKAESRLVKHVLGER